MEINRFYASFCRGRPEGVPPAVVPAVAAAYALAGDGNEAGARDGVPAERGWDYPGEETGSTLPGAEGGQDAGTTGDPRYRTCWMGIVPPGFSHRRIFPPMAKPCRCQ